MQHQKKIKFSGDFSGIIFLDSMFPLDVMAMSSLSLGRFFPNLEGVEIVTGDPERYRITFRKGHLFDEKEFWDHIRKALEDFGFEVEMEGKLEGRPTIYKKKVGVQ